MRIFMRLVSSACSPSRCSRSHSWINSQSGSHPTAGSFAQHVIAAVVVLVMALAFALMPLVAADSASAADTTPTPTAAPAAAPVDASNNGVTIKLFDYNTDRQYSPPPCAVHQRQWPCNEVR